MSGTMHVVLVTISDDSLSRFDRAVHGPFGDRGAAESFAEARNAEDTDGYRLHAEALEILDVPADAECSCPDCREAVERPGLLCQDCFESGHDVEEQA